jgi:hypothetical protein
MSGDIAAASDMMIGALAARAVEPGAGEASEHGTAGALCLNCGTGLIGAHCHRCGQSAHVHRSVGAFGHELAHGVFHFEGKAFRTLPMLLFRPGELTRRYVAGERARFVSPLAMFLFTVFLMFAVVANLPGAGLGDLDKAFDGADFDRTRAEFARERERTKADIKEKLERIADERSDDAPERALIAQYERDLQELRANDARLAQAQRYLPPPDAKTAAEPDASETWLEKKWRYAKENPKLLIYKVKTSAYKYSWALIPISLPFIWLLFPFRRDVGMYDHAVFATYSLSFMSLLVVALSLAEAGAPENLIPLAAVFIPPFHIYRQLKGAYRLGRVGALWRTMWVLFFSTIATTFFVLFLLVMGASG